MNSKIIQFQPTYNGLIVLCEDGTVWITFQTNLFELDPAKIVWKKIADKITPNKVEVFYDESDLDELESKIKCILKSAYSSDRLRDLDTDNAFNQLRFNQRRKLKEISEFNESQVKAHEANNKDK